MSTTTTDPSPPSEQNVPRPAPTTRVALRLLARRVHFLAGVAIAPFLAVLCLTGFAYAFTPQLTNALHHHELFVDSASGSRQPVATQIEVALRANPAAELKAVIPPVDVDRTTQVVLSMSESAGHAGHSTVTRTVYVDPYTNRINGTLATVSNRPPVQTWLREFHGNLHLGEVGRLYSEFVASWLPIVVVGGLVLWLGQRRRKRELLVPKLRGTTGRPRLRGLHGALGLWLAAGLLAVSVTGLTWSNYAGARFDQAIDALDGRSPSLTAPAVAVPVEGLPITVDRALEAAASAGLTGELTVTPPAAADRPFKIAETSQGWPIQKDSVAVDPYLGTVTGRVNWDDYPLTAKLTTIGIQAHSGTLLGPANQIAMALLAIGTLVLLAVGYRMWWQRRPAGRTRAPVWRQLPKPALIAVVVGTVALGWVLPVLGVSLAVFLVFDAVNTRVFDAVNTRVRT